MRIPLEIPIDANNKDLPCPPAIVALAKTYNATISSAVDITLNTSTTFLEISAIAKGVFVRFQATASSTNFDEFVSQDTTRYFVVPSGVTVISIIQQAATGAVAVVEK